MKAKTSNRPIPVKALPQGSVVALLAGGGSLPIEISQRMAEAEQSAVVFRIYGEVDSGARFDRHPVENVALEELGGLIARFKRHSITHVLMAGTVRRRPQISAMRWSRGLFSAVIAVAKALARGDDHLLKAIIGHLENSGIKVISVQDVLPELLAEAGLAAGPRPKKRDFVDMAAACIAARAIGALDIGQAAIAIGGRVVALEGIEGTDGLISRTAELRSHGRLAAAGGGVLVKCAKPGQELRADLPAIGPETVESAARAGLAGIGIEAGRSLVLEREETMRRAREKGVFIFGLKADDP